jgi:PknH-like extracellular domain
MSVPARPLLAWCAAAIFAAGCTHVVGGTATRPGPGFDEGSRSPIDVETVMLDQSQMRAITGGGEDLTVIPSMDGKVPVDIEQLAKDAPAQCKWFFEETQTFGPNIEEFHKTTFQDPPKGALISEGAAAYRDAPTARHAFDDLVGLIGDCDSTELGSTFVGEWTAEDDSLRTRPGTCGRDYRVKSAVLAEVTFCAFPESVPEIVMANMLAKVPG